MIGSSIFKLLLIDFLFFYITGNNLLSIFAPVAVMICSQPSKYKNTELRSSAALALSRFMLVR